MGLRSTTDVLRGALGARAGGELVPGTGEGDVAEMGVPTTVDDGLLNEGDSRITDSNAAIEAEASVLGPGKYGIATTPSAGNEGESTIMPGICIGTGAEPLGFCERLREGPATCEAFFGTGIGVPTCDGSFGDDRPTVATGVELEEGGEGEQGVEDLDSDCLNFETFDGVGVERLSEGEVDAAVDSMPKGGTGGFADIIAEGGVGPTFITSPLFSSSSTSLAPGSKSSSLSPS